MKRFENVMCLLGYHNVFWVQGLREACLYASFEFVWVLGSLFVLFLFCFVLFCFVLFCFVLFCFVLFCFALFCFVFLRRLLRTGIQGLSRPLEVIGMSLSLTCLAAAVGGVLFDDRLFCWTLTLSGICCFGALFSALFIKLAVAHAWIFAMRIVIDNLFFFFFLIWYHRRIIPTTVATPVTSFS